MHAAFILHSRLCNPYLFAACLHLCLQLWTVITYEVRFDMPWCVCSESGIITWSGLALGGTLPGASCGPVYVGALCVQLPRGQAPVVYGVNVTTT